MKIGRRRGALLAFSLLGIFSSAQAVLPKGLSPVKNLEAERATLADIREDVVTAPVSTKTGSGHAPFDGKDGMPHDGPWVETNAERERKKTKDEPDEPTTLDTFKEGLKEKVIPQSNDGVMDDPTRKAPIDGTRGTEGGVSEKSRVKDSPYVADRKVTPKKPSSPKEIPELPHSEKEKIKGQSDGLEDSAAAIAEEKDKKKLEKPTDLPEKPHSIPHPENPSSPKDHGITSPDKLGSVKPSTKKPISQGEEAGVIQPLHSLFLSFTMIMFSEIGDKTFLVACLMAMRHDRILVFTAAFSALITMTVLSAVLGHAVPTLIPKTLTNYLASGLFLVFGAKMLIEARKISPDEGVSEEMKEVEMELEEKEQAAQHASRRMSRRRSEVSPYILESGLSSRKSPDSTPSSSRSSSPSRQSTLKSITGGLDNLFSLLLSPAWVQTFVMTFLGEWGDRSQIATIAMAAGQDYWWVTAGALCGHAICTGVAVIGGKAIAGKVSLRTVTMGGAFAFLVFGVIYLVEALY